MSDRVFRFFKLSSIGKTGDPSLCVLDHFIDGIGMESWRVGKGERLAPVYPDNAKIFMTADAPGIKLSPLLGNTQNMLIMSRELKAIVEKHCKNEIEYLPFTLYDHRKRVHSQDYFIVNPIGTFDCLDFKASTITWSKIDPTDIVHIDKRVLDRQKVADAPQLFRIHRDPMAYVLAYELAKEISDHRFANIYWKELFLNDKSS